MRNYERESVSRKHFAVNLKSFLNDQSISIQIYEEVNTWGKKSEEKFPTGMECKLKTILNVLGRDCRRFFWFTCFGTLAFSPAWCEIAKQHFEANGNSKTN